MSSAPGVENYVYEGSELGLFQHAENWKAYWMAQLGEFVRGDVLEAGAGIGANTDLLCGLAFESWLCLEPDASLLDRFALPEGGRHHKFTGVVADLPADQRFDAILYIDVLEHIEADGEELERAGRRLKPGGNLIVLSPAWPFLYSPFDASIGHFRRYTRKSLRAIAPPGLEERRMAYLDSAGMLASAANSLLLKSEMPSLRQIRTWDRLLVPVSRVMDGWLGWNVGKSILAVWQLPR